MFFFFFFFSSRRRHTRYIGDWSSDVCSSDLTSNSPDVKGFSSTFSLSKATRPEYSLANCSMMGATIRQGPHQAAQKSTTINGYFDISEEKLASERRMGLPSFLAAVSS